jgi:hypothetical protein
MEAEFPPRVAICKSASYTEMHASILSYRNKLKSILRPPNIWGPTHDCPLRMPKTGPGEANLPPKTHFIDGQTGLYTFF